MIPQFSQRSAVSTKRVRVSPRSLNGTYYRSLMLHPYRRCAWILRFLPLLLFLLMGCDHYSMHRVRLAFQEGRFDDALRQLDKAATGKKQLPYLFEYALIAHYTNHFEESNRIFEQAEILAEDLYTKSFSREATSLLTSDNILPYSGTRHERFLAHYYRILNYVYLNLQDDILVECRRAERLRQHYADEDSTYNFAGSAFLDYLSGILYEWAGDWNDAYIAYRWAEAGYQQYGEPLGISLPMDIGHALVRLSRFLGFDQEAKRYAQLYGEPPQHPPGSGELILIYESGFVPTKIEEELFFPIFKTDPFIHKEEVNEDDIWEFADIVVHRQNTKYDEAELEYLMRLAIPAYVSNRPHLIGVKAEVKHFGGTRVQRRLDEISNRGSEVDNFQVRGVLVEDIEGSVLATFDSEQEMILLRTVVRTILKYLAFYSVAKEDEFVGSLVNFLNVASEKADTRSWETLPNQIFLVRMSLPAGIHNVTLSFLDVDGNWIRTETLSDVDIKANGKTFLNYRTFE